MKQVLTIFATLLFAVTAAPAMAVTITFDPPSNPNGQIGETFYAESGMEFRGRFASTASGIQIYPDNGSGFLQLLSGDSLEFSMADNSAFSLLSVDLAEYSLSFDRPKTVTFTGFKTDLSIVTAMFVTDGIMDADGPLADFETFNFSSEFRDLSFVRASTTLFSMDNLVVNPVPLPASVWLFGTALVSFIGLARRRKLN